MAERVVNAERGGYRVNSGAPTTRRLTAAEESLVIECIEAGLGNNETALKVGVSSRTVGRRRSALADPGLVELGVDDPRDDDR